MSKFAVPDGLPGGSLAVQPPRYSPVGSDVEVYANVSNLFDKDPPISSLFSPYYDVVGRFFTVGARINF